MTPVTQTKVVIRNSKGEIIVGGNCLAAAIASMLDLPITEVPNFEVLFGIEEDTLWHDVRDKFLKSKGYILEDAKEFLVFHEEKDLSLDEIFIKDRLRGQYYFISGDSMRGVKHICIYRNGELVHDPHPSREGLLTYEWFEKLTKIKSIKNDNITS